MKFKIFLLPFFLFFNNAFSQMAWHETAFEPQYINSKQFKINVKNYGMLIGIQRGKYSFLELGAERNWKKIKLVKPVTYAIAANMEYNFGYNVLGYKAGFYMKRGKINFTYGANLCYYTDFDRQSFGGGPVIGFKLLGFHLTNGYNFLLSDKDMIGYNTLYVSLRYFFPLDKKIRFKKSKS